MKPRYTAETRKLIEQCRGLIKLQRTLPEDRQWTLGAEIRTALAKARVAMEFEDLGLA